MQYYSNVIWYRVKQFNTDDYMKNLPPDLCLCELWKWTWHDLFHLPEHADYLEWWMIPVQNTINKALFTYNICLIHSKFIGLY